MRSSPTARGRLAAAGRSVKWSTRAQIGPWWRAGEAFGARWGGGAGAVDTTGPAGRRGLRARSGLDVVKGVDSGKWHPAA